MKKFYLVLELFYLLYCKFLTYSLTLGFLSIVTPRSFLELEFSTEKLRNKSSNVMSRLETK